MKAGRLVAQARDWARTIKRDVVALWLAARDPRTPWYAKALAALVAAYALSPIDLIPDFIPVLGLVDDIILVPLGVLAAIRLVPPVVMAEMRVLAAQRAARPRSRMAAWMIVCLWLALAALISAWLWRSLGEGTPA
ncbi:YkvA family protein [Pedomonas mirosovicensis]|uniref:YkvA family protein n=1 Tax=Pedomonas mirosovicensis TaxID=2908641 RepID=UPI002167D412|nr:YkvA family protein [Pedomonas mirosovicensis]MCH8683760.1 DUF1232 domain-containing protein [Pedomonas mirosovicensis]